MSNKINLIAVLTAKEGKRDELKNELLKLVAPTRNESGCLNYELFEVKDNPGTFYFQEAYESKEALDKHAQSTHLQTFIGVSEALLAEPLKLIFLDEVL